MKIVMRHHGSDAEIICKKGFSWTTLFFGAFVPLLRGDLRWFAIMFIAHVLLGFLTVGIGNLVLAVALAFIYNGMYIKSLKMKGFKEIGSEKFVKGLNEISQNATQ